MEYVNKTYLSNIMIIKTTEYSIALSREFECVTKLHVSLFNGYEMTPCMTYIRFKLRLDLIK